MQTVVSLSSRLQNSCNNPHTSKNLGSVVWSVKFTNAAGEQLFHCWHYCVRQQQSHPHSVGQMKPQEVTQSNLLVALQFKVAKCDSWCMDTMLKDEWIQQRWSKQLRWQFLKIPQPKQSASSLITMNSSNHLRRDVHLAFSQKLIVCSFLLSPFSTV